MSTPRYARTRRVVELIEEGWTDLQIAVELDMTVIAIAQLRYRWIPGTAEPQRKIDRHPIGARDLLWVDEALCSQVDPELFFPEKGGSTAGAKSICRDCPVTADCLEFALSRDLDFGVYGGLSDKERKKLRRGGAA